MLLPEWYEIVLGISFIIYIGLLSICLFNKELYPGFSIYRDTISEVQDTSMKTSKYINPAFGLMGIVLLPLPFYFLLALKDNLITIIAIVLLHCMPSGLIILAIFPNFTNKMHYVGAGIGMGGTLLSMLLLIYPILNSEVISDLLIIPIILALTICIPLVYSNATNGPRSQLIHNPNIWEWVEFFCLNIFILGIYFNLLFV